MSTRYEIPLTPQPQRFFISLNRVSYQLLVKWNPVSECWILDISSEAGSLIIGGIALVTGVDLLEQYGYLRFGGQLICQTDGNLNAVPTFENLGVNSHLYFIVP